MSADLPQCQRVPATNGFRVRGPDVKSLDCDPASHAGQKATQLRERVTGTPVGKLSAIPWK